MCKNRKSDSHRIISVSVSQFIRIYFSSASPWKDTHCVCVCCYRPAWQRYPPICELLAVWHHHTVPSLPPYFMAPGQSVIRRLDHMNIFQVLVTMTMRTDPGSIFLWWKKRQGEALGRETERQGKREEKEANRGIPPGLSVSAHQLSPLSVVSNSPLLSSNISILFIFNDVEWHKSWQIAGMTSCVISFVMFGMLQLLLPEVYKCFFAFGFLI